MRILAFTISVLIVTLFTSCKKCDPSNSSSGLIVEDAIVRVIGDNHSGGKFISSNSEYPVAIEVSLDGGISYGPVNFGKYSVFSLSTTSSCSSGYDRNVNMDASSNTATYTVTITECTTCDKSTTINNWVLTSKVPSNYTPIFSIK